MSDSNDIANTVKSDREGAKLLRDMLPGMTSSPTALVLVAALIAALEVSADTIERLQKELDFRRELDSMPGGKPE